jgi:hypothetical protein
VRVVDERFLGGDELLRVVDERLPPVDDEVRDVDERLPPVDLVVGSAGSETNTTSGVEGFGYGLYGGLCCGPLA